jgi:hypothetical protein
LDLGSSSTRYEPMERAVAVENQSCDPSFDELRRTVSVVLLFCVFLYLEIIVSVTSV